MRLVEPTGDPEVEEHGAAVGLDEEVPAVQVAVEDAVEQRALEAGDEPGAQDLASVSSPECVHGRDVVEREAAQPLHDEHAARHEHRVRAAGTTIVRCSVEREHPRQVEHVLGLEPEVELLDDLLGEQLDERGRVGERRDGMRPTSERRQPGQGPDVGPERGPRPAGRWTFTTTSSPVTRRAAWTCAIDAAAIGSVGELGEHVVERAAELALDDLAHLGERLGRDLVAELLELVDELVGEQALERRDDLAELDVGRSPGARTPGAAGVRARRATAACPAPGRTRRRPRPRRRRRPAPGA